MLIVAYCYPDLSPLVYVNPILSFSLTYIVATIGIAITEGGVIPATLVYLGGFYKGYELATRLAWFWGIQVIF